MNLLATLIFVVVASAVLHQLLTGVGILAFGQALKLFRRDLT